MQYMKPEHFRSQNKFRFHDKLKYISHIKCKYYYIFVYRDLFREAGQVTVMPGEANL